MNLNIENWKEFKIKDIFRLEPTKGVDSTELLEGNDINYIGAKHEDNGLMLRCQLEGFESWVSKGNCIVFIQLGAGSAGYVNYIPDDFIGMNGKTLCGYIDGIMNSQIGLFLETVLCKERPKYSFGRSWTGDRLRETIIKLPADSQGNPDWKFMEDYINSINSEPITTKNKQNTLLNVETKGWKEYQLSDVFDLKGGYYNKKPEHSIVGDIPFLASTETNNGVTEYYCLEDIKIWDKVGNIDNTLKNKIYKGNCIAVTVNGSVCNAFYQKKDFTCSHDITALYTKNHTLTQQEALFLCTIIMKEKYRWSYGRKPHDVKKFSKSIIKLPTKNNQPDWECMENYIKSLPYGDRI